MGSNGRSANGKAADDTVRPLHADPDRPPPLTVPMHKYTIEAGALRRTLATQAHSVINTRIDRGARA